METFLNMPMYGEVMEEGTVYVWKKKAGDQVEKGEIVLEIETDKATVEVESPATGTVKEILVSAGETVPVHTPLMVIE